MHDHTPISRATRRALAVATAVAVAAGLAVGVTVGSPGRATAAPASESEAADYASDVHGDAWDFINSSDFNTDFSGTPARVTGGALKVDLAPGNRLFMVHSISGSLATGRDGARQPVDPARYSRLTFSMDQPLTKHIGAVYWFTCREQTSACGGGFTFPIVQGPHVYSFDLTAKSNLLAKVPWRSAKKVVFRVDPVILANGSGNTGKQASIDWMRLHAAPDATHPHAGMPAGTYSGYTVTPRPQLVVDSPNPTQGQDYATATTGRPWNFTSAAATSRVRYSNTTVLARDSRGITARNNGPRQNDPQVHLPVSRLAGSTYHHLQFDLTYDGPFDLSGSAGGGKMARAIWNVSGTGTPQISNDILTYSSGNAAETTVDLTAQNPLDEDAIAPKAGWGGQTITGLRFDPNEDPGKAVWHLKSVHLRADPAATGSTNVTFHDNAWVAGSTADVAVRTGSGGWQRIASGVAVTKGSNTVPFRLGSRPAGKYAVQVTLRHPDGSSDSETASAPVVMKAGAAVDPATSHDPIGNFERGTGTTSGVTLTGWAYDPDASAVQVRVYDRTSGSRSLGTVTTSIARSDVRRARPAAPANSGWSLTVPLSAGSHKICAYGLNTGPGTTNPLLGACRQVTVGVDRSHEPVGRLDTATVGSGGVTVTGWAYDPDTRDPLSVAFYDRTSGSRNLGRVSTSVARPDVVRAHPAAPANSGYTRTIALSKGTHELCTYGINVGAGTTNPLLGCRSVTVR
ncbi:hypothetical protein [Curtobacterium sp. MCBD17_021]|uniref:hypothetical protein n=1 Tax=Curtobacterium sp. MCBD17_021 TaxID=2175665 RepID=UPI0011B37C61|nr:hypothetical protein [Curtobacterium sp. MCBD17_021]